MLWIKAFHIVFVITWFSGLFYLPRLFVYHALGCDTISHERFLVMEKKLYYGITLPSAVLATFLGVWLAGINFAAYSHQGWFHSKLTLVGLVWIYTFSCQWFLKQFKENRNLHSHIFYRIFNEIPVLLLIGIIILVVVKPF